MEALVIRLLGFAPGCADADFKTYWIDDPTSSPVLSTPKYRGAIPITSAAVDSGGGGNATTKEQNSSGAQPFVGQCGAAATVVGAYADSHAGIL